MISVAKRESEGLSNRRVDDTESREYRLCTAKIYSNV